VVEEDRGAGGYLDEDEEAGGGWRRLEGEDEGAGGCCRARGRAGTGRREGGREEGERQHTKGWTMWESMPRAFTGEMLESRETRGSKGGRREEGRGRRGGRREEAGGKEATYEGLDEMGEHAKSLHRRNARVPRNEGSGDHHGCSDRVVALTVDEGDGVFVFGEGGLGVVRREEEGRKEEGGRRRKAAVKKKEGEGGEGGRRWEETGRGEGRREGTRLVREKDPKKRIVPDLEIRH
jgi:hypothetical protein